MIGRPRAADEDFAVFKLAGRAGVAVLIALHRFFIDQVGDIDEHAATIILATTHIFLERMKEFVYLDRDGASLSLPFPMPNCLFPEPAKILAADRSRQFDVVHGFAQRAVLYHEFEMHFRLAPQSRDRVGEGFAIGADSPAHGFVRVEDLQDGAHALTGSLRRVAVARRERTWRSRASMPT